MISQEEILVACRIRQEIESDIVSKKLGKLRYYCNWCEIEFVSSLGDFSSFRCDGQFLWEYFFRYDVRILEIDPIGTDAVEITIDSENSDGYYRKKTIPISSILKDKETVESEVYPNLNGKFELFTKHTLEYIDYYENTYRSEMKKLEEQLNSRYRKIFNIPERKDS